MGHGGLSSLRHAPALVFYPLCPSVCPHCPSPSQDKKAGFAHEYRANLLSCWLKILMIHILWMINAPQYATSRWQNSSVYLAMYISLYTSVENRKCQVLCSHFMTQTGDIIFECFPVTITHYSQLQMIQSLFCGWCIRLQSH